MCLPLSQAASVAKPGTQITIGCMVITHTKDRHGNIRVYLGGYASLECWIEPKDDGISWTFHADEGVTSFSMADRDKRCCAQHALKKLCELLNVTPDTLKSVPFETIVALHNDNPFESRRTATPKRTARRHAYMSTSPDITRPATDFSADDYFEKPQRR